MCNSSITFCVKTPASDQARSSRAARRDVQRERKRALQKDEMKVHAGWDVRGRKDCWTNLSLFPCSVCKIEHAERLVLSTLSLSSPKARTEALGVASSLHLSALSTSTPHPCRCTHRRTDGLFWLEVRGTRPWLTYIDAFAPKLFAAWCNYNETPKLSG